MSNVKQDLGLFQWEKKTNKHVVLNFHWLTGTFEMINSCMLSAAAAALGTYETPCGNLRHFIFLTCDPWRSCQTAASLRSDFWQTLVMLSAHRQVNMFTMSRQGSRFSDSIVSSRLALEEESESETPTPLSSR